MKQRDKTRIRKVLGARSVEYLNICSFAAATRKRAPMCTPVLESLRWIPVSFRIKILLLVFKALNGLITEYFSELPLYYEPVTTLRSSGQVFLLLFPKLH